MPGCSSRPGGLAGPFADFAALLAALLVVLAGYPRAGDFQARTFRGSAMVLPYRLHVPTAGRPESAVPGARGPESPGLPLVLALHGSGMRGTDNRAQVSAHSPAVPWAGKELQSRYPALVVAPQCPPGDTWVDRDVPVARAPMRPAARTVMELLDSLVAEFPVDPRRIYLVGYSMGGHAAWELPMRYPGRFAATVPICGRGDTAAAALLKDLPVWAFHGAADPVVPVSASRGMVAALRRAGGAPRYTEYPGMGHDAGTPALREPGLAPWLFAQARRGP